MYQRGTEDITASDLQREFGTNGTNATAEDNGDGTIIVTFGEPSNRVYTIDTDGNVLGPKKEVQPGEIVEATVRDNYTDIDGNKATVPAGFVVSKIPEEQKVSNGLVIYDIPENELETVDWITKNDDGAYNVQTLYNQFVWIPVVEGTYERDFSYPSNYASSLDYTPDNSTFTDTGYLPEGILVTDEAESNETAERNAVMKYNGFYLARYEMGKDGSTVISKQNATIYMLSQTDSKSTAKTMYTGSVVKSALCSGIQWDMVMKFVDKKNDAKGNQYNVREYNANRHTVRIATAGKNEYDKVQNIYDLEGNFNEWIAEKNSISDPFVYRGGNLMKDINCGASRRNKSRDTMSNTIGFRSVLYVM